MLCSYHSPIIEAKRALVASKIAQSATQSKDEKRSEAEDLSLVNDRLKQRNRERFSTPSLAPKTTISSSQVENLHSTSNDLKQRNLERFSPTPINTSVSKELLSSSSSPAVSSTKTKRPLQPKCTTMCPLQEISERQDNNEISMLEQLHPDIFPTHFTLKDTCIKRFRRSAADVDLSVDNEVRDVKTLEKSMSFLEEWIMERDRQGVDPRSPNNTVPAPLDVYQFMWNRTRMIRKDFLLQNIPKMTKHSSSVPVDLDTINIAIRVHERLTRWHALCEHQLSHLDEWTNQSSQNLVEMGQCLKSLNMLYDQRRQLLKGKSRLSQKSRSERHGITSSKVGRL